MMNNFLRNTKRALRAAGVELTAPFKLGTFRKSFAQNHADAGTPPKTLATLLGAMVANGKLVRVSKDGYYEVTLATQGGNYTTLLPIASTVIMAAQAESNVPAIEVER